MNYRDKLLDPRWQRKRLEVFQRAGWKCQACGTAERTLHVHHLIYSKGEPWEAPDATLESLCEDCHQWRTELDELWGERYRVSTAKIKSLFAEEIKRKADALAAREIGGATED